MPRCQRRVLGAQDWLGVDIRLAVEGRADLADGLEARVEALLDVGVEQVGSGERCNGERRDDRERDNVSSK